MLLWYKFVIHVVIYHIVENFCFLEYALFRTAGIIDAGDMQSIMTQFDAFGIPTAILDYVLDSYRSPRHRENSSFFPSQSSHPSTSIDEIRNIKISKFRRGIFAEGSPDFVHAYRITSIRRCIAPLAQRPKSSLSGRWSPLVQWERKAS